MDVRDLTHEAEAARALLANIRDVIGDDDQAAEDFLEGETGLKETIAAAVEMIGEWETFSGALEIRIKEMQARKHRFETRIEATRAAIAAAMGSVDLTKMTFPEATLTVKATPPKVIISSEVEIPAKFWIAQDPKIDRKALLAALKEGAVIDGASLSTGGTTLQIRKG